MNNIILLKDFKVDKLKITKNDCIDRYIYIILIILKII